MNTELLVRELGKAGFVANPEKSATMSVNTRRGKWFTDSRSIFKLDEAEVSTVGINASYRYLGAQVGVDLEGSNPRKQLVAGQDKLSRASLKPQQRMQLLREHLLPKFYHQLVLLKPSSKSLCALDYEVRSAVKRWLKVKEQCPRTFIHSEVKGRRHALTSTSIAIAHGIKLCANEISFETWCPGGDVTQVNLAV